MYALALLRGAGKRKERADVVLIAENYDYDVVSEDLSLEAPFFALPVEVQTVVFLGDTAVTTSTTLAASPGTLAMLGRLDAAMIDDSENEPPDFVVPGDDLGF